MGQWYRTDKQTGVREPVDEMRVWDALYGAYRDLPLTIQSARQDGAVLDNGYCLYDYKEDRP